EPLEKTGQWLRENGGAVYGQLTRCSGENTVRGNGACGVSRKGNTVYLWNWIWPEGGAMGLGGYLNTPKRVYLLKDGTPIDFEHRGQRILLKNMPAHSPDELGIAVIALEFDEPPVFTFASYYPQLHQGREYAEEKV
ncbi:MAG: hypothetical protein FWF60_06675, partial [Oscillospiraceae bacterium]|nr:hypothetical protein [Oscillospiraceae bacterium]